MHTSWGLPYYEVLYYTCSILQISIWLSPSPQWSLYSNIIFFLSRLSWNTPLKIATNSSGTLTPIILLSLFSLAFWSSDITKNFTYLVNCILSICISSICSALFQVLELCLGYKYSTAIYRMNGMAHNPDQINA